MSENENLKSAEVPSPRLQILKSEFECLPAYMKGLASWEVRYFMRCFWDNCKNCCCNRLSL